FIERKVKNIIHHSPKFLTLGCCQYHRIFSQAALLFSKPDNQGEKPYFIIGINDHSFIRDCHV
ncbi:hypothetical protein KJ656_07495, partial [bacterium]|nr:hypothetical protein [bacterium]